MKISIPAKLTIKWQEMVNTIAEALDIPTAMITVIDGEYLEIFRTNENPSNSLKQTAKIDWFNTYCQTVIKNQQPLIVSNAYTKSGCEEYVESNAGYVSYLGVPINYPDNRPMGTICVLDKKKRIFKPAYKKLLQHFKSIIENDLKFLLNTEQRTEKLNETIAKQQKIIKANKTTLKNQETKLESIQKKLTESKRVLNNKELKYKAFIELAFEALVVHTNGIVLDVNSAFTKLFGYTRKEILNKNIVDLLLVEEYKEIVRNNISKRYTQPYEVEVIRKDGNVVCVELEAREMPLYENVTSRIVAIRDISFRKKTSDEIKKLSIAVEQSANSIVITDKIGKIEYVNHRFTSLTGYTKEESLGKNIAFISARTQPESYFKQMFDKIFQGKNWRGVLHSKKKDGSLFWENVTVTPLKNEKNEIIKYLAIKEDITQRKRVEEQLKNQLRKFSELAERYKVINKKLKKINSELLSSKRLLVKVAENYPNSYISLVEKDYTIGFTAGQEFKKLGLNPQEYYGLNIDEIFSKKSKKIKEYYKKTFQGKECEFELFYANQYLLFKTVPLYDSNRMINRILAVVENITDRKNAELELVWAKEQAEESEKLKSDFIKNMSHEIRTPLNGIIGFIGMLKNPSLEFDRRSKYINVVENSVFRLLTVINNILQVPELKNRKVRIKEEVFEVSEILEKLYKRYQSQVNSKNVTIILDDAYRSKKLYFVSDKNKVYRTLSILLENALKFTIKGSIEFGYTIEGNFIRFFVKDTGKGIDADKHRHLFKPFSKVDADSSLNNAGFGLGLSIVKENIKLLGGSFKVESEVGKGATFYVNIPYKRVNNNKNTMNKDKKYTILIAEDEEINFYYLESLLEDDLELNCNILHAKNGKEAVALVETEEIDLVLMDLKMPQMNGFEATKVIKKTKPDLKIVAQTAFTTQEDKSMAYECGCDDFIAKPISEETLSFVLNRLL